VTAHEKAECCQPGDVTITPIPTGFMVGRSMPKVGLGPWWEYIKTFTDYDAAVWFAVQLAAEDQAEAWVLRNDRYEPLILGPRFESELPNPEDQRESAQH
jgi:hypothetical protein